MFSYSNVTHLCGVTWTFVCVCKKETQKRVDFYMHMAPSHSKSGLVTPLFIFLIKL